MQTPLKETINQGYLFSSNKIRDALKILLNDSNLLRWWAKTVGLQKLPVSFVSSYTMSGLTLRLKENERAFFQHLCVDILPHVTPS